MEESRPGSPLLLLCCACASCAAHPHSPPPIPLQAYNLAGPAGAPGGPGGAALETLLEKMPYGPHADCAIILAGYDAAMDALFRDANPVRSLDSPCPMLLALSYT